MDLKQLQQKLLRTLFDPQPDPAVTATIVATAKLNAAQRLQIYSSSILGNKIKSLQGIYPVCERLVGIEFFAAMTERYCIQTPALGPDLNHYGDSFANFIANFKPAATLPYLADLTRLEWAWHRAFNGPPAKTLDWEVLQAIDDETLPQLCFQLPEKCSLMQSPYPTLKIWQVNQVNFDGDPTVSLDEGPNYLVIWRKGFEVRIEECPIPHWYCLKWFQDGLHLDQVCDLAQSLQPAAEVTTLLPELASRGWLCGVAIKP
jgi:hypothetical protein